MYETQFVATTSADWAEAIEIINDDTNLPLDLTGSTFELEVGGHPDCHTLSASTADGGIVSPQAGIIQWRFPASRMEGLASRRTHSVGLTMTDVGGTIQIFTGTLALIDGVV